MKLTFEKKYLDIWNVSEEKINDFEFMEKIEYFSKSVENMLFENNKNNLKTGDWIYFKNGYDVKMIGKIFGFGKDNTAYIIWDCYWATIKLEDRLICKIERGFKRDEYLKNQERELNKLKVKRQKLSDRYVHGDLTQKKTQSLNAELNWVGMYISQTEERINFCNKKITANEALSEYNPSGFHCYKGIRSELEKLILID